MTPGGKTTDTPRPTRPNPMKDIQIEPDSTKLKTPEIANDMQIKASATGPSLSLRISPTNRPNVIMPA
jgi:hypothetical protein